MNSALIARLEEAYSKHPLTAGSVLKRVEKERGTLLGITEINLAETIIGGPTDQNHIGGATAVRSLANAVGLQAHWTVFDIGTGLGGTPRLLADEYSCRCHGVEITTTRYNDALKLTELVGLSDRVTFTKGNFLTATLPGEEFDLAIAQETLMHFPDMVAVLKRIASCLKPGGILAVQEAVLLRKPTFGQESQDLFSLLQCWNGQYSFLDDWLQILKSADFQLLQTDEISESGLHDFEVTMENHAQGLLGTVSPEERKGWELGYKLLCSRCIGFVRLIAVRGT